MKPIRLPKLPRVIRRSILLQTAIIGVTPALADEFWVGDTSTDWNTAANWTNDTFPTGQWTVVNMGSPHLATITANSVFTPTDIGVGRAATGRLDHLSGTARTGGGNWMWVGMDGGNGTYNLANTGGVGGPLTGFATGSGTMNVQSSFLIGAVGGTGTVNINTTGALNVSEDIRIVDFGNNSTGTLNLDAGAVNVSRHIQIGKVTGGTGTLKVAGGSISGQELRVGYFGGTGTVTLSGGSIVTDGWTTIGGNGSTGNLNVSGGTLTVKKDALIVADNGTSTFTQTGGALVLHGELIAGQGSGNGTHIFSSGTLTSHNWVSYGRDGGTAVLNMSGGAWNHHSGGEHIVIGSTGTGTANLSGGLMNLRSTALEVGEWGNGTLTVSGAADLRAGLIRAGLNSGSTGTINFNGGTIRTRRIAGINRAGGDGAGNSTVRFNGSQIVASAGDPAFISNLDTAEIQAGGFKIHTNGFNIAGNQALSGGGGIVKSGEGTASLPGAHTYSGTNLVEAGKLTLPNHAAGTGAIQVNAGASLGISEAVFDSRISPTGVNFAGASTLDISFTDISGNTRANAPLNVTGTLALGGPLTVNVADAEPNLGVLPLISYSTKSGAGPIAIGTLPENVSGTLQDNGSVISLNVTSTDPLAWDGDTNQWNLVATNWYDEASSSDDVAFTNGRWVNFDDLASGTTDVVLSATVSPGGTLFENAVFEFTLGGTGAIAGGGSLVKRGAAAVTISTANTYTGFTRIESGVLSIPAIANGGAPSPIGQSSSAPGNLILAGGTLAYTGGAAVSNRGIHISALNSTIRVTNALTFGGTVQASGDSNLFKTGAGNLTLNAAGVNAYGSGQVPGGEGGLVVREGGLTLGGAGSHVVTGELQVATLQGVSANLALNNTTLAIDSWLSVGRGNGNGALATVTATDSSIATAHFSVGFNAGLGSNDSDQNITLNGTTIWNNTGLTRFGESAGSEAAMTLNGSSQFTTTGTGDAQIGVAGSGVVTINGTAAFTSSGWLSLGRVGTGSSGTVNVNGGTFRNINPTRRIIVGEEGAGILNISGTGSVTDAGNQTNIGQGTGANGTINLMTGGSLTIHKLAGGAGTSEFKFDGGTLIAGSSNNDFLTVNTATVSANGGTIHTNGFDITVNQPFSGNGGLIKTGAGTLTLNGASTHAGATVVSQGTLGGAASLPGGLQVNAAAAVNPGNSAGTMNAGATTIAGTYVCEIDGAAADRLNVAGALNVAGGTLDFDVLSSPAEPVYIIASYQSLVGTFAVVDLPAGYSVNYNYLGGNQIALVSGASSPYDTWAASFGLNPATDGAPGFDKDGDGQTNLVEFAFGGSPVNGANNARIHAFKADSSDPGTEPELLMTVAVRSGTPAFTPGSPATASFEGLNYSIEGSANLGTFATAVTPVAPVTTALPAAPAGYEYRSFSLDGSNGLPNRGFLRAKVTR